MRRRRAIVRAPVTLVCALCTFVLSQIALTNVVQSWRPEPSYDPEYAHKLAELEQRLTENGSAEPLIITIGSSRTATAFRPETVSELVKPTSGGVRIFNFGICRWWSPITEDVVLERILRKGIRPKAIWFEVLPAFLTANASQVERLDLARMSRQDLDGLAEYAPSRAKLYANWMISRSVPAFSNRFLLLSRYLPGWVDKDKKVGFNWATVGAWGWTCLPGYDKSYGTNVGLLPVFHKALSQMYVSVVNYRIYRGMLQRCRENGIQASFVLLPEDKRVRDCYTPLAEERLYKTFEVLDREFRAPLMDMRAWLPDEAFVEGLHLTHSGAEEFTKLVNTRIVQTRWRAKAP